MAEVELNVVCKHCGAEVSPYITECPYCGNRLRKRAPKLRPQGDELGPRQRGGLFRWRRRPTRRPRGAKPLAWMSSQRPYGSIALVLASSAVYLINRATTTDLGAIVGPLDNDWWRLLSSQFNYDNVGYLFAVAVAVAIFGVGIERRYGWPALALTFLGTGAVGMYVATVGQSFPIALGGNAGALGLLCAWLARDLRDRGRDRDSDSDLLGATLIAVVLVLMPALVDNASWWAGLGGAASGALVGLLLPERP